MQIAPSLPGAPAHRLDPDTRGVGPGAAPRAAAGPADDRLAPGGSPAPRAPLTRGLKDFDPTRQSGVAGAQLAGVFLDRLQQGRVHAVENSCAAALTEACALAQHGIDPCDVCLTCRCHNVSLPSRAARIRDGK